MSLATPQNVTPFPIERTRRPDPQRIELEARCQPERIEAPQIRCEAYVHRQPGDDREHRCEHNSCYRFNGKALCGTHGQLEKQRCICLRLGVCP